MSAPSPASKLLQQLTAPFPAKCVLWRMGTIDEDRAFADATPYIDARTIQNRLDSVISPWGWRNTYVEVVTGNRISAIRCKLELCIDGHWYSKEDGAQVDVNTKPEYAIKGAYSDALKRAAVQWGLGRYLHELARAMPQIPCRITRPSTQNSPAYAEFELAPVVPPEFVAADEVEAAKAPWEVFQQRIKDSEAQQEKIDTIARLANEEVTQRAASASAQADNIARGYKGTHVPNTDAFSLRAPLVPSHQVPDGQQPTSVMALLDSDASARVTGSATSPDSTAMSSAAKPLNQDSEARAATQPGPPEQITPPEECRTTQESDAPVAINPEPSADAASYDTAPVDALNEAPRRNPPVAREAAASTLAEAEAPVESSPPSPVTVNSAPESPVPQVTDTGEWILQPEEDESIFKDTLAKVRSGKIPVNMLVTYIRGPRLQGTLNQATIDHLVALASR